MVSMHSSGGCDPGSSPGRSFYFLFFSFSFITWTDTIDTGNEKHLQERRQSSTSFRIFEGVASKNANYVIDWRRESKSYDRPFFYIRTVFITFNTYIMECMGCLLYTSRCV